MRKAVSLVLGLLLFPLSAFAQTYPVRPITMVVPFPAGGPSDVVARIIAEHMGKTLHQPVVIENIGGAGGLIALRTMASASPDGYTLLINSVGPTCTASTIYKLNFDPAKLFIPAGTFATDSCVLVVGPAAPAKTLAEQ